MEERITLLVAKEEMALLTIIRTLGHGTIERIGVRRGLPSVIVGVSQRIDLTRENELSAVLGDGFGRMISLENLEAEASEGI